MCSYALSFSSLFSLSLICIIHCACHHQNLQKTQNLSKQTQETLKPTALSTRFSSLEPAGVSPCLLKLVISLNDRDLSLSNEEKKNAQLAQSRSCASILDSLDSFPDGLVLWAQEHLSIGGVWADRTESSHELTLLAWNIPPSKQEELGKIVKLRWVKWTSQGIQQGISTQAPPPHSLTLTHLIKPAKPNAERGGWWAHLALWLPFDHLGYEFSLRHPQGWPVGSFGPPSFSEHTYASVKERRWWIPQALRHQGRVLYLSLTPSWAQLTRWAWTQLTDPLSAHPIDHRLQEGIDAALMGKNELNTWIQKRIRYHYSPLRRYQPRPPLQSLKLGYGDCKDLSALAHILLKYANHRSWFALTSQKPLLSSARSIPSMGWFDHVLLWTPSEQELEQINRQELVHPDSSQALHSSPLNSWFDATSPGGKVHALKGRWAYVLLNAQKGVWIQIGGLSLNGASPKPQ